jgi:hypothetical protein
MADASGGPRGRPRNPGPARRRARYNREPMRIPWVVPLLVAAGCGGSSKPAPDLSTHEGIADAMIQAREELVDVLENIKDAKSAEAAKPALRRLAKRESQVYVALKKIGEPVGDEKKRLKARVDAAMEKLDPRMDRTFDRLKADPATWAVVDPMMEEYFDAADPDAARKRVIALRVDKTNKFRAITAYLVLRGEKLPMKDGALDVYALVKDGTIGRGEYSLFRARPNGPPSDEEIERGDYTNFPWARYHGNGSPDPTRAIPLVWDRNPDADGYFVVGMSDGSALAMHQDELAKALGK